MPTFSQTKSVLQGELSITYLSIHLLRAYPGNARTHSKRQIRQIAASIATFGFSNPVLIDKDGTIIAGHGRVEAAKLLGLTEVPTILLGNLTENQIRAYVIADNKLAENAGWDKSILAIELQHLLTIEETFDVTITGFEVSEIDMILQSPGAKDDPADELPEEILKVVTEPGDLWRLRKHRILCADARLETSFTTLMEDRRASVVYTDPPFNVRIDGHASGNGKTRHREFAMASGEMSPLEFTEFLVTALTQLARFSTNGSVQYIAMDWRHSAELLVAGSRVYDSLLNTCVWVKDNGGLGSFYRSQHEFIFVFKSGKNSHRNNIQLGRFGRNRTNVWRYPGANTMSRTGEEGDLLALHPTVKPVALIADAILDCSARGEIVLDSFLGSGSTILAAERVGRVCRGLEIDPHYVDTAIRRWQRYTGDQAVHIATGQTFDERMAEVVHHG